MMKRIRWWVLVGMLFLTSCTSIQKAWIWEQIGKGADEEAYLEEMERLENEMENTL